MKFLSAIFDFMFAPAGSFDPESSHHSFDDDTSHFSAGGGDSHFSEPSIIHSSGVTINPATCLPMIEDSGIDIMGSPFGFDIHHTDSFICDAPVFTHDCS